MSIKIPIETSARHIHVSQEDFQLLFGEDAQLHYIKELSQPGQYLCQERLTVKGPKGEYQNMAILGPFRKETQIELPLQIPARSVFPVLSASLVILSAPLAALSSDPRANLSLITVSLLPNVTFT